MREYYRFDEDGYYIEPVITEGYFDSEGTEYTPEDLTEVRPPDGLYRGKFDKNKQEWVETGSPPEIDPEEARLAEIAELKRNLDETDYKIIKSSEYSLAGEDLPYDILALHGEREALRVKIRKLEAKL
ncbi:MAG: hypothetical protein FWH10_08565 [Oscillospiraceae bacterium]|nr:hypothetical protein [Oscillospiraceae bacterium]